MSLIWGEAGVNRRGLERSDAKRQRSQLIKKSLAPLLSSLRQSCRRSRADDSIINVATFRSSILSSSPTYTILVASTSADSCLFLRCVVDSICHSSLFLAFVVMKLAAAFAGLPSSNEDHVSVSDLGAELPWAA